MVKGYRLARPCMLKTERQSLDAEAVAEHIRSDRISTIPPNGRKPSETVFALWIQRLEAHRCARHA